jgi:uncharacterized protein
LLFKSRKERKNVMNRVVHFEFAAEDPKRAVKFYENVFGWKIQKWDGPMDYWLVSTGKDDEPGINGGIMKKGDTKQLTVNTLGVSSIDELIKKIVSSGGKVIQPRTEIPGVGFHAYVKDTEGNIIGLMESTQKM